MPKGLRILHLSLGEPNLPHFGGIFLIHQFYKKLKINLYLQKKCFHLFPTDYFSVEFIQQ